MLILRHETIATALSCTAPYYPQSNGKKERWYQSFKAEGWRPGVSTFPP